MDILKKISPHFKKNYLAAMQIMRDAEAVRFYYDFQSEVCRAEEPSGDVYLMRFDGATFLVGADGRGMLVQGCPYPWKVGATAYFYQLLHQHRHRLPFVALGVIMAIVLQALLLYVDPYGPGRWFFMALVPVMTALFFVVVGGMFLVAFLRTCGPALVEAGEDIVRKVSGKMPKALNAGDFHIGEDILVYSYQDESGFAFSERCEAKRREGNVLGKFVFIVPYDSLFMQVVYPDGWVQKVTGHLVPDVEYAGDNWHKDKSPLDIKGHRPKGSGYLSQPYEEFLDFVRAVCPAFRAWAEEQKMSVNPNAFDTMINLKKAAATFVFVCLSVLSVVAQDLSGQINKYLGTLSGKAAPQTEIVCYFKNDQSGEEFEIKLASDGMATWSNIVKAGRFDNNRTGRLQAIFAGEDKVVPSAAFVSSPRTREAVSEPAQAPTRPDRPFSFLDWILPLEKIGQYRADIDNGIADFGKALRPRQDFLGYVGWKIALPILAILFGLFWWLCKLSFHEMGKSNGRNTWQYRGMSYVGYGSRWGCFIIVSITALSYVINDMIYRYFAGGNMLVWLALNGLFIWLSLQLAKWAVPDPPGSHNVPANGKGGKWNGGGGNGDFPMPTQ